MDATIVVREARQWIVIINIFKHVGASEVQTAEDCTAHHWPYLHSNLAVMLHIISFMQEWEMKHVQNEATIDDRGYIFACGTKERRKWISPHSIISQFNMQSAVISGGQLNEDISSF